MADLVIPPRRDRRKSVQEVQEFGDYRFIKTLGEGSFGKVKLAEHIHTGKKFAVKILQKKKMKKGEALVRAQREIKVLSLLRHPSIAQLYEVVDSDKFVYLVLEYAAGGELFDYIVAHKRVKEREARGFFRDIISAVDYCHTNFIIHRDLKPENLLLSEDYKIKIIDFGFSNTFSDGELLSTFCGSPAYAAPEMVVGQAYTGPQVDIWSLGVILFALTCGFLPFDDPNVQNLYAKIVSGDYTAPFFLSDGCKDLIARMLVVDPQARATIDEIKEHPWVTHGFEDEPLTNLLPARHPITELDDGVVAELGEMGFPADDVVSKVSRNEESIELSSYHLVLEKRSYDGAVADRLREALTSTARTPPRRRRDSPSAAASNLEVISEDAPLREVSPSPARPPSGSSNKEKRRRRRRHSVAVTSSNPENDAIAEMAARASRAPKGLATLDVVPEGAATTSTGEPHANTTGSIDPPTFPSPDGSPGTSTAPPKRRQRRAKSARKRRFSLDAAMSSITSAFSKSKKSAPPPEARTVKGPFSVATTSEKDVDALVDELLRVLGENEIEYVRTGYLLDCTCTVNTSKLRFEAEICRLEGMTMNGVRLKRVQGDTWAYKRQCLLLLSQIET